MSTTEPTPTNPADRASLEKDLQAQLDALHAADTPAAPSPVAVTHDTPTTAVTPEPVVAHDTAPSAAPAAPVTAPAAVDSLPGAIPAVPADPTPVSSSTPAAPATTTPAPSSSSSSATIPPELQAYIDQLLADRKAQDQADATKPPRALPSIHDVVSFTSETGAGLEHTRYGIVIGIDTDNRKVLVNWLPDGAAELPVDDLDD